MERDKDIEKMIERRKVKGWSQVWKSPVWEVIHQYQLKMVYSITSWNVRNLQKNDRGKRRGCCCCCCCSCSCCCYYDQIKRIAATINYTSVKLFPISLGHCDGRIVGLEFKFGRLNFFSENCQIYYWFVTEHWSTT